MRKKYVNTKTKSENIYRKIPNIGPWFIRIEVYTLNIIKCMEESTIKAVCAKKLKGVIRLCGLLTTHPDCKPMGLYPGGLKSRINFALEAEWAFIRDFTVVFNLAVIIFVSMIFLTRNFFLLVKSNFLFTIDWSKEKPTITYVHFTWCNN